MFTLKKSFKTLSAIVLSLTLTVTTIVSFPLISSAKQAPEKVYPVSGTTKYNSVSYVRLVTLNPAVTQLIITAKSGALNGKTVRANIVKSTSTYIGSKGVTYSNFKSHLRKGQKVIVYFRKSPPRKINGGTIGLGEYVGEAKLIKIIG